MRSSGGGVWRLELTIKRPESKGVSSERMKRERRTYQTEGEFEDSKVFIHLALIRPS